MFNVSYAKYYDENYVQNNAGIAKFGSWKVEYTTTPVNIPDDAKSGYYAYVASFRVSFTPGEVKREYSLKIKTAPQSSTFQEFDTMESYSDADFYYSTSTTIYTTLKNSSGNIVATSSNVASTLTSSAFTSFSPNKIYISNSESTSFEDAEKTDHWESLNLDDIYEINSHSLNIHSEHPIYPNDADFHVYKIIFFYNYKNIDSIEDFKFIYSLNVEQVV